MDIKVFVTIGTQLPFPRLIDAVEVWAQSKDSVSVIAQSAAANRHCHNMEIVDFLTPQRYAELAQWADVIVGHAGMGTIITGFEYTKPLILMPRLYSRQEHRNDHQLATASKFSNISGISIVSNEQELIQELNNAHCLKSFSAHDSKTRAGLLTNIKEIIWN